MFEEFKKNIKHKNLIKATDKIIVGLSGGPDSVCLFHLLCKLKNELNFEIVAAHLNHEWRATANDDLMFCKELAEKYNVPFVGSKASEIKFNKKLYGSSKEELGRTLRRQFFQNLLKEENATAIALGHHWDDQAETFFIRLIRGSTIAGLSAMEYRTDNYIRPLLNFTKNQIIDYLQANNHKYLIDESNDWDIFLRNKIRKYLMPLLNSIDQRCDQNLKKAIESIQETNKFIAKLTEDQFQKIIYIIDNDYLLDKEKFLQSDPYLQKRLLLNWLCKSNVPFSISNSFLEEIIRFIKKAGSGTHHINQEWSIVRNKQNIKIEKKAETQTASAK